MSVSFVIIFCVSLCFFVLCLPEKLQGFIGPYHPLNGLTWPGEGIPPNTSVYNGFKFGISAIYTEPSYGGFVFEDNIKFHCFTANTNFILGMLSPPTEGGVVNNPNDTDVWKPTKPPGLIQSAHRYSEIAKVCPQILGITIDDFLVNFETKKISLQDVKDIRGALLGKSIDRFGTVDHSSPSTTPWLKLFICFYAKQISDFDEPQLVDEIDGVNLWTFDQDDMYVDYAKYVDELMNQKLPPGKQLITGAYIKNSKYGYLSPKGFNSLIETSIDLYDDGKCSGMFIFSGIFLGQKYISKEKFDVYNLPHELDQVYYPYIGTAQGVVKDGKTGKGIDDAIIEVYYSSGNQNNKNYVLASRKKTDEDGKVVFSAWAGKKKPGVVVVTAEKVGDYQKKNVTINLKKQETIDFVINL